MLVDGISRDDIKQGILGDCWFLSSRAAVSQQEKFMRRVRDQLISVKTYVSTSKKTCLWLIIITSLRSSRSHSFI